MKLDFLFGVIKKLKFWKILLKMIGKSNELNSITIIFYYVLIM